MPKLMRNFNYQLAVALCLALAAFAAACKAPDGAGGSTQAGANTATVVAGATPHPTSTPGDGVRRITVEEAQEAVMKGEAVIVDVRAKANYDQGHIKGSICVPRTEIDQHLAELPKDKLIIFYCA